MKINLLFFTVLTLITFKTYSQTRKISISAKESIIVINNKNNLEFELHNGKNVEKFTYGAFESGTSIDNKSVFLISDKNLKIKRTDFLSISDSIFLFAIADWKDRYFVFLFKRDENLKIVPYMRNEKVKEFFVSAVPYIYFDSQCKVMYNIHKEILEYNYVETTKNYMILDIYNLNDLSLQQDLETNTIKLDSDTFKFYSQLYDNDSVIFFEDVYTALDKYLNLCR